METWPLGTNHGLCNVVYFLMHILVLCRAIMLLNLYPFKKYETHTLESTLHSNLSHFVLVANVQ